MKILDKIRMGIFHASYHRNMKHAKQAQENSNIKNIYTKQKMLGKK